MSYFNVSGRASGSIQIAHNGIWLSTNNVYSRDGDISAGQPYLALTLKRFNSTIETSPTSNKFQESDYALLRVKTPNTDGSASPEEVATVRWVQSIYGTSALDFNIDEYVLKTNWLTKNRELENQIQINVEAIFNLQERVADIEINDIAQDEKLLKLNQLVDWGKGTEKDPAATGLIESGLILYGGRAAGWG